MWTTCARQTIFIQNLKSRLTETVIASTGHTQVETRQILSTEKGKQTKVPLLNKMHFAVNTCIKMKINFVQWSAHEYFNHIPEQGPCLEILGPTQRELHDLCVCVCVLFALSWFEFFCLKVFVLIYCFGFEKKNMLFGRQGHREDLGRVGD